MIIAYLGLYYLNAVETCIICKGTSICSTLAIVGRAVTCGRRSNGSTSCDDFILGDVDSAVATKNVLTTVMQPALRRCAAVHQVGGHTRRRHSAPAQAVGRRDRLDDQRPTHRVRVLANCPRRPTNSCISVVIVVIIVSIITAEGAAERRHGRWACR